MWINDSVVVLTMVHYAINVKVLQKTMVAMCVCTEIQDDSVIIVNNCLGAFCDSAMQLRGGEKEEGEREDECVKRDEGERGGEGGEERERVCERRKRRVCELT